MCLSKSIVASKKDGGGLLFVGLLYCKVVQSTPDRLRLLSQWMDGIPRKRVPIYLPRTAGSWVQTTLYFIVVLINIKENEAKFKYYHLTRHHN